MADLIALRVLERFGAERLLEVLSEELQPSELASVLLAVHERRSRARTWPELFEQYQKTAMFSPSAADPRALHTLDRALFDAAHAFAAIELAPVSPFALNALAGIPQNNVLSAVRAAEVLADPTTQKALESARRRKRDRARDVRLCSSDRVLRMQPLPKVGGYAPHFRLFTATTAGRVRGGETFEHAALIEHVAIYLDAFRRFEADGYRCDDRRVSISHTGARSEDQLARLEAEVFTPLRSRFHEAQYYFDHQRTQGANYYAGYRMRIDVRDPRGESFPLCDGGFSTWTQSMLADKKERFFASAIGTELVAKLFRR